MCYLRECNIYNRLHFFYLQTRLFFLFYHSKCLNLARYTIKRDHLQKYHFIFFFSIFMIDISFVWEVLYKRSCSTKEAAHAVLLTLLRGLFWSPAVAVAACYP